MSGTGSSSPDVFSPAEIDELRRVTDEFVRNAAAVTANDEVYDLEDTHSRDEPRVRRLKAPHLIDPAYFRASRNGKVVAILKELWDSVRFDTGKLNMKSAGYGAPVEWHQGWAFYPHTNDDLAAVGIMLDDIDRENGPMLVVPVSRRSNRGSRRCRYGCPCRRPCIRARSTRTSAPAAAAIS